MRISAWSSDVCSSDLRAIDLRSVRIFVEPDAILDTIIGRRATGDQPPSGPAGGRQITAQLAVAGFAIPGRRVERLAIGSCSHHFRIARGGGGGGGAAGVGRSMNR